MPVRLNVERDTTGLREALADTLRTLIGALEWTIATSGYACPWPSQLEAIEAGEPVEVAGWEIPREFKGQPCRRGSAYAAECRIWRCAAVHAYDDFIVAPDGSFSLS